MKYYLTFMCIFLSLGLFAQAEKKEEGIKKNWNFGALPAVSFDTDLGFQYGALVNLFDYGNGSRYPRYDHSLYFEVSQFTKGSGLYIFCYNYVGHFLFLPYFYSLVYFETSNICP